ncbi:MAG: hypothetical protein WCX75_03965 [Fibrobacteraceae bacterium]
MAKRIFTIFLLLFLAFASSYADGGIPLPHQSANQPRGINVGLGLGGLSPSGKSCNGMGVWQGMAEYFYTERISAGWAIKMYGGNLDQEYALIYQRYHIHGRIHFPMSETFGFYISPIIGFETTDLSKIRKSQDDNTSATSGNSDKLAQCSDEYSLNGFSAGIDVGMGWKFATNWGFISGLNYDQNSSPVSQFSFTGGIAYNLRNSFDFLEKNFLGTWLSLELVVHHYWGTDITSWGKSLMLGINLSI